MTLPESSNGAATADRDNGASTSAAVADAIAAAEVRDDAGAHRDREAALRDRLAEAADAQIQEFERSSALDNGGAANGDGLVARAVRDRERAAADRAGAATQRAAAARDRVRAARDRQLAASDRAYAAAELAAAGLDDLTGALRRGVGLTAVEREIARAHRTGEPLVLAFVDVDGLKAVNDFHGHVAGDRLLQRAAHLIKDHLRPYDVTVRVGGDEFVCCLYGVTSAGVRPRFRQVRDDLGVGRDAGSVSVGLADLEPGDSLDDLMERADAALLATRGRTDSRSRPVRRSRRPST
jgi:diguanylate cyclase (GGDEF)-like protein